MESRYPPMGLLWICKIAVCASTGNAGNVFPATDSKGNRYLTIPACPRHVRDARDVMHVGIANPWWLGKRTRNSRHMHNPQAYVSGKRPMANGNNGPSIWINMGSDKMAAFSHTIFSVAILRMKSFVFWVKIHWSLFLMVHLTIIQHRFI